MESKKGFTRRGFVKASAAVVTGSFVARPGSAAVGSRQGGATEGVPHRPLGKTGALVSCLGVGGYHLGSIKEEKESTELVALALDAGVNFFDNCWEYHDGVSEERLGVALKGKRDKAFVMTKVCTHGRGKEVAMKQLEESLRRLQTDHVELWQIHEVVYWNDPEMIFAPNGAAEALLAAKQQGKVRFVGFTGHKNPAIHLKMLAHDFPFDTVQMPLNALDATFRSFQQQVLPEAKKRGLAVLGMKSLGGSGEIAVNGAVTPEEGLRYAMSLPVATTISGMDSMVVLEQNLNVARGFKPFGEQEMAALRERVRPLAADGRYELFKTTTKYDGNVGREQHHYPPKEKLPA
ncbi:MAG: Aldo/keto reductase [Candidatus Acidoferrum typicum]|nr:Aldo/keto reductase [Candidatus Acidoferrum typicum]